MENKINARPDVFRFVGTVARKEVSGREVYVDLSQVFGYDGKRELDWGMFDLAKETNPKERQRLSRSGVQVVGRVEIKASELPTVIEMERIPGAKRTPYSVVEF